MQVTLRPLAVQLRGAEVVGTVGTDPDEHVRGAQLGSVVLPIAQLRTLPALFGEVDPVRSLQLLPGVQSGGEGSTGIFVRGGSADQNLVLLDGAPVYNPGHLLNFFSVFNADAVRSVELLKGALPAAYGGRLSSVLLIEPQDGDRTPGLHGRAGLGLIASRLTLGGPVGRTADSAARAPGAWQLSGRRTYLDLITKPFFKNGGERGVPFYFYDLNGRISYTLSKRDRLSISAYHGADDGGFTLTEGRFSADFRWGNTTATARWQHTFRPNLRLNTAVIFADYSFDFISRFDTYYTSLQTGVRDGAATTELQFEPSPRHQLRLGFSATHHRLRPRTGDAATDDGQTFRTTRVQTKYAREGAAWLSDDWSLSDRVLLSAGLRWSGFQQRGPFTQYFFNDRAQVTDSVAYAAGAAVRTFHQPEPRLAVRVSLGPDASVKASWARTAQYLHLVSNATSALPLDVWVPAGALAPAQYGDQWSAGYFRNFGAGSAWETSVEAYYRTLHNQLEYRDGYAPGPSNRDLEYEFVTGAGRTYGLELFVRRTRGRLTGWLSYTLARATRTFPTLNAGQSFPFRFDRRHDLSVVAAYALSERWALGATLVYGTGLAVTLPVRAYVLENSVQYQYGSRNNFRVAPQHRLDLSATWHRPARHGWQPSWNFSVYNAYARANPFFYYLSTEGAPATGSAVITAKKVSIFPFPVPSVTYEIEF